ncbi:MAG: alanine--tRNA ligase, partial [Promethearchaeota archaeon]
MSLFLKKILFNQSYRTVKAMNSRELREKYLEFFREKKHAILPSASLLPDDDPTVLFTTAGMHPLVPFLLGQPHSQGKRLTNCQKCIRTSDIDEVGDTTHLTFFEMLGNWSLGDYFKKEAIKWSYEFLTDSKWLGIDLKKLSVTVFEGDDQIPRDTDTVEIWRSLGIPEDRIFYLPREDNFWGPAGETGPCGPCTEMFYDTGKEKCSPDCKPGCSCGKYFEIWNDVFMTYKKTATATYELLKQHNVDTGMGVERTVAILSGMSSVYEIDTIQPLISLIQKQAGIEEPTEEQTRRIRIIADHIKAATFILADDKGITPSNVEQGYIVRRLIRKAIREGNLLNIEHQFLSEITKIVIDMYRDLYPELQRNSAFILSELDKEGQSFTKSLNRGLRKFNQIFAKKKQITGKDAFLLFTS